MTLPRVLLGAAARVGGAVRLVGALVAPALEMRCW